MGHGHFSSEPEAVWLTEDGTPDRRMKILHDFSFTDPRSRVWEAPAGSVVDGASIPRALWTVVGSPYTGDYRRASIVHDVACDEAGGNTKKRRAADRMFFHGCRAGGLRAAGDFTSVRRQLERVLDRRPAGRGERGRVAKHRLAVIDAHSAALHPVGAGAERARRAVQDPLAGEIRLRLTDGRGRNGDEQQRDERHGCTSSETALHFH